jgi:CubicO group peptidase (beta-lactamase class C family)
MTRPTTRRSILGALGAGAVTGVVGSDSALAVPSEAPARPTPKDLPAYARFVADRAAQDLFSGTVLVAHQGRPVLSRSFGMANRERSLPNRPDTVFWLASVSKVFTALAVMQLVAQGRARVDDPLGTYLDGFAADAAAATVHQLLTHTSGIGRPALGPRDPAEATWNSFDEVMNGTVDLARRTPLQFPPGTRHTYSNDGYSVLAAVVAAVSGRSYTDYLSEHVFMPAGMARTAFLGRPDVLADDRVARPYWTQRSGTRVDFAASPHAPFTVGPSGGAYTTAADLLAFTRALAAGTLLNRGFVDVLTAGKVPVPLPVDPPAQAEFYGYGHRESIVAGTRIIGHSGSGPGAATRLDVLPDSGWVSIVLSNYDTTIGPVVAKARDTLTAPVQGLLGR